MEVPREETWIGEEAGGEHRFDLQDRQCLLVAALGHGVLLDTVVAVPHEGDQEVEQDDGVADAEEEEDEGDQGRDA